MLRQMDGSSVLFIYREREEVREKWVRDRPENTHFVRGSITVQLTSCLTGFGFSCFAYV